MLGISHGIVEKTENDKYRLIGVYIHKTKTNQSRSNIEFMEIILRKKNRFLTSSLPFRNARFFIRRFETDGIQDENDRK